MEIRIMEMLQDETQVKVITERLLRARKAENVRLNILKEKIENANNELVLENLKKELAIIQRIVDKINNDLNAILNRHIEARK